MSFPSPFYRWRPHPWHGLEVGPNPPDVVHAFIEMTPFDHIKYEVDKTTGYLYVDRPQRTSSLTPTLYGFIPRTYSGERVRALSQGAKCGDGDPLDICIVSERPINRSEIFLNATVVGVLQFVDNKEADDKIISVLENDHIYGRITSIGELPKVIVERLKHYFHTYKMIENLKSDMKFIGTAGPEKAKEIICAAIEDYQFTFGNH